MTNEPPPGYNRSRAALRDKFGSRRIDASAPHSKDDYSPSARAARLRYENPGMSQQLADRRAAQQFRNNFRERGMIGTGTFGEVAPSRSWFDPNAVTQTPYGTVTGSNLVKKSWGDTLNRANTPIEIKNPQAAITPQAPGLSFDLNAPSLLDAPTLASYMPSRPAQYTPPWMKRQQGYSSSLLQKASRWLES